MIKITKRQARQRWDDISETLREALVSPINTEFLQKICQTEHLSDDKSNGVARLAGYVLLGFMHPGDLAMEIKEVLQIEQRVASSISEAINDRIFNLLKDEIDGAYDPILEHAATGIVEEIRKPTIPMEEGSPFMRIGPVIDTKQTPTPTHSYRPIVPPKSSSEDIVSEFRKLSVEKKGSEEAPKIIHEEPSTRPSKPASSFRLDISVPKPEEKNGGLKSFWPPRPTQSPLRPQSETSEARPEQSTGNMIRPLGETKGSGPITPAIPLAGKETTVKKDEPATPGGKRIEMPKVINYTDVKSPFDRTPPVKPREIFPTVPPRPSPPPPPIMRTKPQVVAQPELPKIDTLPPSSGEVKKESVFPPKTESK